MNEIQEIFKDLLNYDKDELKEQFEEWELNDDDMFKLKIIIKIMKENINKSQQKEETKNDDNKDNSINLIKNETIGNEINDIINKKNKDIDLNKKKKSNENIDAPNSFNIVELVTPIPYEKKKDNYLFYCVIEVFTYDTSQREKTYGLRNPTENFKKICENFNIKFENDCSFIDYNDADKIELSTFMLWGSKKSIKEFLKENNIENLFIEYMKNNDYLDKAGIYLCLNTDKNIGYLIIWPGKFSYYYSKITEPNDNILLTLIRYGFSISSNSILCFTKEELEKFDFNGYEIFQDNDNAVLLAERNKMEINKNKEKTFKIGKIQYLTEGLNIIFKNKNIVDSKINQNCVFFYEHQDDNIDCEEVKNGNFDELIGKLTHRNIYFEDSLNIFDIPKEIFYSLIKTNPCYLENKNKDEICSGQQLNDILEEKIKNLILNLNKQLEEELLNNNFYNKFICIKCKKTKKENNGKLYYFEEKKNIIKFVHESCNNPKKLDSDKGKCFVCQQTQKKSNEFLYYFEKNIYFHKSCNPINKLLNDDVINLEKYKIYENLKNIIINDQKYEVIKTEIQDFFVNCESKFSSISKFNYMFSMCSFLGKSNPLKIDDKIIEEKIKKFKAYLSENKIDLFGKKIKKTENEQKIKKWKQKWKENINKYFNDNKKKLDEWIILKSCQKNQSKNNKIEYKFNYEINKKIKERIIVNLYEIMSYAHSTNLTLSPILHSKEFIEKEKFENYFHQENEGLIIYKNEKKIIIYTNESEYIEFIGLYDYDNMSKTLIVYKEEDNRKKIGIYFNKENNHNKTQNLKIIKDLDINSLFYPNSKINKIKLIPCVNGYENQSVLLFIDNEIQIRKIKSDTSVGVTLYLKKYFDYKNFDEFQFIVYLDFLLILQFNEQNNQWEAKVFSLYIEDMSIFQEIKNTIIILKGINKEAKFSFAEIKEKKYLFAVNNSESNQYSIILYSML